MFLSAISSCTVSILQCFSLLLNLPMCLLYSHSVLPYLLMFLYPHSVTLPYLKNVSLTSLCYSLLSFHVCTFTLSLSTISSSIYLPSLFFSLLHNLLISLPLCSSHYCVSLSPQSLSLYLLMSLPSLFLSLMYLPSLPSLCLSVS